MFRLIVLLIGSVIIASCSNESSLEQTSRFKLSFPPHPDVNAKSGNLSTSSTSVHACYAINITGTGISQSSMSCGPELGEFSGFLPPQATVDMSVISGTRTIDLWLYLSPDGSCPAGAALSEIRGDRLIKMGSTGEIMLEPGDQTVYLEAQFPGLQANFAKLNNLAADCFSASGPP